MLELPHCLVIEATDEPDYFGFYSPDLKGFTGIGHSVEDCLYQAKWGMREFVQLLAERNIPIPPRSQEPTVIIMNMRREQDAPADYLHGVPSPLESWKKSSTWKQIKTVFDQASQPSTTIP